MNNKVVYLIRHGESTYNANMGDDIDCNLTELGIKQCKDLGEKLKDIIFDLVIVSPLARTQQTFSALNLTCIKEEINYLCREHCIAKCDFMMGENIIFESEVRVRIRCTEFREYLKKLNYSKIAVIGHADFINFFTTSELNEGIWLDNADYTIFNL